MLSKVLYKIIRQKTHHLVSFLRLKQEFTGNRNVLLSFVKELNYCQFDIC
jgi:hypothetical protein